MHFNDLETSEYILSHSIENICILFCILKELQGNEGLSRMLLQRGLLHTPQTPELYCALGKKELAKGRIDEVSLSNVSFICIEL